MFVFFLSLSIVTSDNGESSYFSFNDLVVTPIANVIA